MSAIIAVRPPFNGLPLEAQIQDIGNQLSMLLYGKPLTTGDYGVLGKAQSILSKSIKGRPIQLHMPVCDTPTPTIKKRIDYIHNMANHARLHGITINIITI
jgi:hypothetical protein